jgi:hypothetical protein
MWRIPAKRRASEAFLTPSRPAPARPATPQPPPLVSESGQPRAIPPDQNIFFSEDSQDAPPPPPLLSEDRTGFLRTSLKKCDRVHDPNRQHRVSFKAEPAEIGEEPELLRLNIEIEGTTELSQDPIAHFSDEDGPRRSLPSARAGLVVPGLSPPTSPGRSSSRRPGLPNRRTPPRAGGRQANLGDFRGFADHARRAACLRAVALAGK